MWYRNPYLARPLTALLLTFPLLGFQEDPPRDEAAERRLEQAERKGGSELTEKAVRAGLQWLARHQDDDGKWNADDFPKRCADEEAKCDGPGLRFWDAGVTGLALVAYLGAGQTHREGEFKETVAKGIGWLKANQMEGIVLDGAFGYVEVAEGKPKPEWIYNHAICTIAICEALAATGDPSLEKPAERAVALCLRSRNESLAWRYDFRSDDNDTSVTGWMVQALGAARRAGLKVPDEAFEGALEWLDRVTGQDGATGYRAPDGASSYLAKQRGKYDPVPCMTATGILSRLAMGQKKSTRVIKKGKGILRESLPEWPGENTRTVNMYYWYYGTYAMCVLGGIDWKKWNGAMQEALLPHQRREGDAAGSWDPVGEWGIAGGRVYSTAIAVLTLEVYYRYDKVK